MGQRQFAEQPRRWQLPQTAIAGPLVPHCNRLRAAVCFANSSRPSPLNRILSLLPPSGIASGRTNSPEFASHNLASTGPTDFDSKSRSSGENITALGWPACDFGTISGGEAEPSRQPNAKPIASRHGKQLARMAERHGRSHRRPLWENVAFTLLPLGDLPNPGRRWRRFRKQPAVG